MSISTKDNSRVHTHTSTHARTHASTHVHTHIHEQTRDEKNNMDNSDLKVSKQTWASSPIDQRLPVVDKIASLIKKSAADHVRIKYYHSFLVSHKNTSNDQIIFEISPLKPSMKKNVLSFLESRNNLECVTGTYSEYGINDTYVRVSNVIDVVNDNDQKKTVRNFFRRKTNVILSLSNESQDKYDNVIVLEFYYMCEEEDLPYVINYHHNNKCNVVTYNIDSTTDMPYNTRICFTKKSTKTSVKTSIKTSTKTSTKKLVDEEYMDINTDIDIGGSTDIDKQLHAFINNVNSFNDAIMF
jgi:hypothetical protein